VLATLSRQLAKLGERSTTSESISLSTLEILAGAAIADRAAVLRETQREPGTFQLQHSMGFGDAPVPESLSLGRPPAFYFTSSTGRLEKPAAALSAFLGVPYVLWSYDKPSGYALLLGNVQEGNTARPYQDSDRGLIDAALDIYVGTLLHKAAPLPSIDTASADAIPPPRLEAGLQEAEIKEQLRCGGRVTGMVAVERSVQSGLEFAPYLTTSWRGGYSILRTARDKSNRTYKDYSRLRQFARVECDYQGPITTYLPGSDDLRHFPGILPEDLLD
jgi:hypothetical protein